MVEEELGDEEERLRGLRTELLLRSFCFAIRGTQQQQWQEGTIFSISISDASCLQLVLNYDLTLTEIWCSPQFLPTTTSNHSTPLALNLKIGKMRKRCLIFLCPFSSLPFSPPSPSLHVRRRSSSCSSYVYTIKRRKLKQRELQPQGKQPKAVY
jgi:hypothetical protein